MNFRAHPLLLAVLLVVACAALRLLSNWNPALLPGFTPLVALSFVAAVYLPHRWSWVLGVAAMLLSELAFLRWNYLSEGHFLSAMMLLTLGFYLLMGLAGTRTTARAPLARLFGGPLLGSLLFYVATNTYSWGISSNAALYNYPPTFAGWVQANTTGWPGYPPTWLFLRNALAGDLVFTALLIALFAPARFSLPADGAKVAGPAL